MERVEQPDVSASGARRAGASGSEGFSCRTTIEHVRRSPAARRRASCSTSGGIARWSFGQVYWRHAGRRRRRSDREPPAVEPTTTSLALAAPAIAQSAAPGQFVMVEGRDAATIRCCAARFRSSRSCATLPGSLPASRILSKRIGPSTASLYDARPGQQVACLGPLGRRSPSSTAPTKRGWSPAASASRRSRRWPRRCARAAFATTLFYGARRADELFYLDFFRALGVELVLTTEDGSAGERGRDRRAARSPPCGSHARRRP